MIITKVVKDEKTTWDIKIVGEDPIQEVSIDDLPEVIEKVDIKNESILSVEERLDKLERQMHILQNK